VWQRNLVSAATCNALNPDIAPAECRARMSDDADFAIHVATRYLTATRSVHHRDVPLVAAVLDRGGIRCSRGNHWHIASDRRYIDHFVAAYNAYRTSETRRHRPPACGRRVTVTVAAYQYVGNPGEHGIPQDNGCWTMERVAKDNPEWEICNSHGELDHGHGATHWAYDDTNGSNGASHDASLITQCAHRAWSWGYVYMANRGAGWLRRVPWARRYFAEIYSSNDTVDDQFGAWSAQRGVGEPMINLVPSASSDTLYRATRRLCSEVGAGGHLGLYVHDQGLVGPHLQAVVQALNDCTRP
jgi:hypothetical protein